MWRQHNQIHSTFTCFHPHLWPSWFPDCTVHEWSEKCLVGISFFRLSQWSNIPMSGEERFKYPLPQENKIGQMPHRYRRANPHPMPCLPPSSTLIGALRDRRSKPVWLNCNRQKVQMRIRSDCVLCIPFILSGSPNESVKGSWL